MKALSTTPSTSRIPAFKRLALRGSGMEFASEMVIKAALKGERIAQVPATLSPDQRGRPPHLRPWRDGWRHLRYLLMLSPTWVFAVPAAVMGGAGVLILLLAGIGLCVAEPSHIVFGNYWIVLAGALTGLGHSTALLALATHLYGVRAGYRLAVPKLMRWSRWISLETMLAGGVACFMIGLTLLVGVVGYWSHNGYGPIETILPAVLGTSLLVIGTQTALGGFLLAIISGNEAAFLSRDETADSLGIPAGFVNVHTATARWPDHAA